jgi:phospholipid transport system substrate-binding protein
MSMHKRLAVFLLSVFLIAPFVARAETGPREVVQGLCDQLLQAMKQGQQLGFKGRLAKLAPAVSEAYDMPATAKATLGVAWSKLNADEAHQLIDAFARLSVASYADQFDGWDGERFEVGEARPSAEDLTLIPSKIITKAGQATEIDYLMHQDGSHWRIVDVLLDGTISQTAVRRSEFVSIFRRDGFAGLIGVIDNKIAAMETK